jgi:death-on-curing protein
VRAGESVEGILGRVESNLYYRIDRPTVLDAAALITYALAVGHIFNDANKRTAYFAGMITLELNGSDTGSIEQLDLEEIVVAAGNGEMDMDQFMVGYKGIVKT